MEFIESLILVSEKAAKIARAVREEKHLLSLLVQEKKDEEKNPRFVHDFKTLADVLVQEVVKHDLGEKFPDLVGHIHGEESNEFVSKSGETIHLHVGITKDHTKQLLNKVLNDGVAAEMLASIVHTSVSLNHLPSSLVLPNGIPDIPLSDVSVWIDPIGRDFFTNLYSSNNLTTHSNDQSRGQNVPDVLLDEVDKAIKFMKKGKVPENDRITIEMIKSGGQVIQNELAKLFTECLQKNTTPEGWNNAVIVLLHKKDSTGEYISAENKISDGVYTAGLPCVTVLIGAFLRDTGVPIAGVINQPFHSYHRNEKDSYGNIVWGISYDGSTASSLKPTIPSPKVVVISTSENDSIRNRLAESGLSMLEAAGAGYKLLCVIEGNASAYVLSKGTTFFWDTCSCDAILRSLGGGILDYGKAIRGVTVEDAKLVYSDRGSLCNSGGIIAFVNKDVCDIIVKSLGKDI